MQLNNFYEHTIWNEWTQLLSDFKKRSIRQFYYPHNMDTYYQREIEMVSMQRQQINNVKNNFHQLGHTTYLTTETRKIWCEQSKIIKDHTQMLSKFNNEGKFDEFFTILNEIEQTRLTVMSNLLSEIIEEKNRQEAAETLIMMQKQEIANEKRRITNEKRRMAYEEAKQKPQILRRSARIGLGKTI